jgi:hypothetical protein
VVNLLLYFFETFWYFLASRGNPPIAGKKSDKGRDHKHTQKQCTSRQKEAGLIWGKCGARPVRDTQLLPEVAQLIEQLGALRKVLLEKPFHHCWLANAQHEPENVSLEP